MHHMPYATALTLTRQRALDTTLSQNAMRFHGRLSVDRQYNGFALDNREGERIATAMQGADISFFSHSLPLLFRAMAAGRGTSPNAASQNASTVGWLPFTCRM